VLDIYLHPSAVDGEKGVDTLVHLIDTYFGRGGFGIQFNIMNADDLRRAQQNPEEYATLQVRVCGWNVYFVTLNTEQQNHFIETTMQTV
jgi:formate C-acetyltransferase